MNPLRRSEGWLFLLLLIVLRLTLLASLGAVVDGVEFTDDWLHYRTFLHDPMAILLAHDTEPTWIHAYPPLQPLLVWLTTAPWLAVVPSFYALRLGFLVWEILAWPFVWALIRRSTERTGERRLLAAAYLLTSSVWVSSVVMCQEESIGLLLMAIVCWLLLRGRQDAALVVCGIGVVASKVFFLVPLGGLLLAPTPGPPKVLLRRAALGLAPIVAGYALPLLRWTIRGWGIPLAGLTFHPLHSTSFWALLAPLEPTERIASLRLASIGLCGLVTAGLLACVRLRRTDCEGIAAVRLIAALLLWVFACFYIVQPEYYQLVVPALLVLFRPRTAALVNVVVLALSWPINFFYGVWYARLSGAVGGRTPFLHLHDALFPIDPRTAHVASVLLWSACSVLLAWAVTAPLCGPGRRRSSETEIHQPMP